MSPEEKAAQLARAKTIEAALMRYRMKVRTMDAAADRLSAELTAIRLQLFQNVQRKAPFV